MSMPVTRLGLCCTLSVLGSTASLAQSADAPADSAAERSGALEDIVVTARKTSENLQRVPVAVTTISSDTLLRSGIKDTTDLQTKLPGVQFTPAQSLPIVIIRGLGTQNNGAGVDSTVAYSIDGIYLAHTTAVPPVLVDIARIESVRGPQGTLFGRNSNGGGINYITGKPVLDRVEGSGSLSVGNYSALGTEAVLNVPVGQQIAIRAAFGSDRHDGYFQNGYDDKHSYVGRVRVLYQPVDNLELIATFDKSRLRSHGQGSSYCPPRSAVPACASVVWNPYDSLLTARAPDDNTYIRSWAAYGEANLRLDWATITSLTSYRHSSWLFEYTYGYPGPSFDIAQGQRSNFLTHETRIASPQGSKIQWLAGIFYSRETGPAIFRTGASGFTFFATNPEIHNTSKAAFGQVTYPITTALRLTGGLRYTDEAKSLLGTANIIGATAIAVPIGARSSEKRLTWRGGIDFDVSPSSLLYANVSNGFKSGGVALVPNAPPFTPVYRPETIVAYQAGSKNRFLGNRLQINAEIFYYDYKNYQTLTLELDPTGAIPGVYFATVNSQKAKLYGGELEAMAVLSPQDHLRLSATYLHARATRFVVGGVDLSGNKLAAAPSYTISGAFDHTFELASGAKLIAEIESQLVGGHYVDITNVPGSYQTTYTRSGANLTFEDESEKWSVSAFVRNIENKARLSYYSAPVIAPGDLANIYPPRTYGLTVRRKL